MGLQRFRPRFAAVLVLALASAALLGCAGAKPLRLEGGVEPSVSARAEARPVAGNGDGDTHPHVRRPVPEAAERLRAHSYATDAERLLLHARMASHPMSRLLESPTGRYLVDWVHEYYGEESSGRRRFDIFPSATETTLQVVLKWRW